MLRSEPRVLIPREQIRAAVNRLAADLRRDYGGRLPLLVGVLKGAFVFLADLRAAYDTRDRRR